MENIIRYITEHQGDAELAGQLKAVIAGHSRMKARQEDNAQFAEKLVARGTADKYMAALLKAVQAGALNYTKQQWVPDEYETLERHGLVHCTFGPREANGLSSRTIEPTQAGRAVVERASEATTA